MKVVVVTCIFLLGACAKNGPTQAMYSYRQALKERDYKAAYRLMSEAYRQSVAYSEFEKALKENPGDIDETNARLSAGPQKVQLKAEIKYGLAEVMTLVEENGQWRIDSNPLEFYSQDTPRDAVRSFVRAIRFARWGVVFRLVPKAYRENSSVEAVKAQFLGPQKDAIMELVEAIESNIDAPIEERNDEARMFINDQIEVKFLLEDGKWRIQDLD